MLFLSTDSLSAVQILGWRTQMRRNSCAALWEQARQMFGILAPLCFLHHRAKQLLYRTNILPLCNLLQFKFAFKFQLVQWRDLTAPMQRHLQIICYYNLTTVKRGVKSWLSKRSLERTYRALDKQTLHTVKKSGLYFHMFSCKIYAVQNWTEIHTLELKPTLFCLLIKTHLYRMLYCYVLQLAQYRKN